MMILPIKKKWYEMILSGEKKEEYREIKPYYTARLKNVLGETISDEAWFVKIANSEFEKKCCSVIFRNGYSASSPSFVADTTLSIGYGKSEWGAVENEKYYVLTIQKIRKLKTA